MGKQTREQTTKVSRTTKGTIEFVIQEEGIRLTPQYKGGQLIALILNDGTKLMQGHNDGPWSIVADHNDNKLALPIKSVSLDKEGHLTIKTKRN